MSETKKKLSLSNKIIIYILIGIVVISLIYFRIYKSDVWPDIAELYNSNPAGLFCSLGFIIFLLCGFAFMVKSKHRKFIEETCKIIFMRMIIPSMIFIIIGLGVLHGYYQYESGFQQNLSASMGLMGNAFYSLYEHGETEKEAWRWIVLIFFIGSIYYTIDEIKDAWKKHKNKLQEYQSQKMSPLNSLPKSI